MAHRVVIGVKTGNEVAAERLPWPKSTWLLGVEGTASSFPCDEVLDVGNARAVFVVERIACLALIHTCS